MPIDTNQLETPETPHPSDDHRAPAAPEAPPLAHSEAGQKATQIIEDTEAKSEVLEEFDFEGRPAQILRLRIGDISNKDLEAHARNLAATNFILRSDIPNAEERATQREKRFIKRERFKNYPLLKRLYAISNEELNKIYPDPTQAEHFHAYRDKSFPRLMEEGNLLAVKVDNKIVATLGVNCMGKTQSGREIYELTKGSVLNDPKYRKKKLHPRLAKMAFDLIMTKNPEAILVSASRNPEVIENYKNHGWNIVPLDHPNEAVQLMKANTGEHLAAMQKQGYQAMYLDQKIIDPQQPLSSI